MEDQWNISFVNERLASYLELDDYRDYSSLINYVIQGNDPKAKWNLFTLLMNNGTEKIIVENLTKQLRTLYCSDENIAAYVKDAIFYNPKLGYVSISSKSRMDMNNDYTLDICIPCKSFEDSERLIKRIEEVLTMMLMEAKTICP